MTKLTKTDARILDARLGAAGVGGFAGRPRYNTQVMTRLIDADQSLTPDIQGKSLHYSEYWDADLQSYMYLQEFLRAQPQWLDNLAETARQTGVPSQSMDRNRLDDEVRTMLELAPEREERFFEIMDQDDADGATSYWFGALQVSPSRHPATYLMVRVGRRIGEHVAMCLKGLFRSPRPSSLCPAIIPMIDPPSTPSFPAGHAVQAYLISYLLACSLPNLPQHSIDEKDLDKASGLLFDLAERVSLNRIVAGLHFSTDIIAGRAVGIACFKALTGIPSLWSLENDAAIPPHFPGGSERKSLRALVRDEYPQYA